MGNDLQCDELFLFFCMTGESDEIVASVLRPFMTEYLYLLSLVMARELALRAIPAKPDVLFEVLIKRE